MTCKNFAVAVIFALVLSGCAQKPQSLLVEKAVAPTTPAPAAQIATTPFPKLPPPGPAEVREAMHRIFGGDVIFTAAPGSFVAGDFNGDGSEDLAVIARPAPHKLDEINSELANWVIQDANRALIGSPNRRVVRLGKEELPKVAPGESILAIIHGFGPKGWRNSEARQAYLVKHAAGVIQGTDLSISQKAIRAMHLPVETEIIRELRGSQKGFIFWTGGVYAWHPDEG